MSKLGEVVFCVDCERSVERYRSAIGDEAGREPPPTRRMAVKKDANGDRLCAPCLDSRRTHRNAEFLLHEGRAPLPVQRTAAPDAAASDEPAATRRILRIASAVRIPRPAVAEATTQAKASVVRTRRAPAKTAKVIPTATARRAEGRAQEGAFMQLAAEVGFIRTRRLLQQLKQQLRSVR
jgi:hypothetical protein